MKKLAFFLGIAIAIFVSAQYVSASQYIDDTLFVHGLVVGRQGYGGVTEFNGSIVNNTTNENGEGNPVTFGDDVRVDGRIYRGVNAGTSDSQPFIVNDNMIVNGWLQVGSTNITSQLSSLSSTDTSLQSQINAKGVGDMSKSTYDVGGNGKIDGAALDYGINATFIGTGTINNAEYAFLNGVTSNLQSQLNAKGVGDMLKSTYDVAGNGKIDAGKIDSGINATLIGGGTISNTIFDYLQYMDLTNTSSLHLTALGINAGDSVNSTGLENTFIGYQAGDANTEGFNNTAIGSSTLGDNISGDNNTAVGYNALNKNASTGGWNTAVGSLALDANTNGVYNVALGVGALGANIGGGSNIGIGKFAGDNITSGSNNIIIGTDLDAVSGVGSNQLNIGNILVGSIDPSAPGLSIDSGFALTPSAAQTKADDSTITIDNGIQLKMVLLTGK